MKVAEIKKIEFGSAYPSMEDISAGMDGVAPRISIDTLNWKEFSYKPDVCFAMAWGESEIYIKYFVKENWFKAEKTETNQMVCEDSCVEFFVSPEEDGIYYNFEFNGIGTCLLGTGTGRENSTRCDASIVSRIRRLTSAGTSPVKEREGNFEWTITVAIPFETFFHHKIEKIKGKTFRANFYKCGDMLKVPHYVTWNPVGTENPDYHQPAYFGLLKFV